MVASQVMIRDLDVALAMARIFGNEFQLLLSVCSNFQQTTLSIMHDYHPQIEDGEQVSKANCVT